MQLSDSGNRTVMGGGAQRDMGGDKGRCDLLPLDVVAYFTDDVFFDYMNNFLYRGRDYMEIYLAYTYCLKKADIDHWTALLKLAKHYERGAKKYEENNWRKNMPEHIFCDSAIRHYIKWQRGDTDEPHHIACLWNLISLCWTIKNCREEKESNNNEWIRK